MHRRLLVASSCVFVGLLVACGTLKTSGEIDDAGPGTTEDGGQIEADGGTPRLEDVVGDGAAPATTCATPCAARSCGRDPVCDVSCGTCPAAEACEVTDAGATCRPPTIEWEVDGAVVQRLTTFEATYSASQGYYFLGFPHWGRNIQISVPANAQPGTVASCPSTTTATISLITTDNTHGHLAALPARWKGLILASCGTSNDGDVVTAKDLVLTNVSPARIAGSYEVLVQGAGPRAGSTLRVRGTFDVTPVTN